MKYSDTALKILGARECGIWRTNAQFWREFPTRDIFEECVSNNEDIQQTTQKLLKEFSTEYCGMVCIFDKEFPIINPQVKNKSEKPILLFYKGDLSLIQNPDSNVAVVGTIESDDDIEARGAEIVRALVRENQVIVSGLALGCDTVAHRACLAEGYKTIAILPSPLHKIIPSQNEVLADKIVRCGGLLVSEYYREPQSRYEAIGRFVERDRLQAMFAKAVILIASYQKGQGDSGSRHAMAAAKKYSVRRYAMYDFKTDETNKKFGLNRDLIESGDAKIITLSAIQEIAFLKTI